MEAQVIDDINILVYAMTECLGELKLVVEDLNAIREKKKGIKK